MRFLLLMTLACGAETAIPDAGTPCSCEHVGAYWWEQDNGGPMVPKVVCRDVSPPPTCTTGTRLDAGLPPCDGVTVTFGAECEWVVP